MADLLAAFLLPQLEAAAEITARRRTLYERYVAALRPLDAAAVLRLPVIPPECQSNYHFFHLLVDSGETRDRLRAYLRARGIGSATHYIPLALAGGRAALRRDRGPMTAATMVGECLVRLPLYTEMTEAQQDRVLAAVRRFTGEAGHGEGVVKVCLACEHRFDGADWQCPVCGSSLRRAAAAIRVRAGPGARGRRRRHQVLPEASHARYLGNFWYESRNALLTWALAPLVPARREYPGDRLRDGVRAGWAAPWFPRCSFPGDFHCRAARYVAGRVPCSALPDGCAAPPLRARIRRDRRLRRPGAHRRRPGGVGPDRQGDAAGAASC